MDSTPQQVIDASRQWLQKIKLAIWSRPDLNLLELLKRSFHGQKCVCLKHFCSWSAVICSYSTKQAAIHCSYLCYSTCITLLVQSGLTCQWSDQMGCAFVTHVQQRASGTHDPDASSDCPSLDHFISVLTTVYREHTTNPALTQIF